MINPFGFYLLKSLADLRPSRNAKCDQISAFHRKHRCFKAFQHVEHIGYGRSFFLLMCRRKKNRILRGLTTMQV